MITLKTARRVAVTFAAVGSLMLGAGAVANAATEVAAANPYTPASACHNDFGGTWGNVADNHRNVVTASGTKWGDVYLMWNNSTKENCVVTIKRQFIGTKTQTVAGIRVEGSSWVEDAGPFEYYAAIKRPACNKRVMYDGWMYNGSTSASGGRYTFRQRRLLSRTE